MNNILNLKGEYIPLPCVLSKDIHYPFKEFYTIGFDTLQFIVNQKEYDEINTIISSLGATKLIIGVFYDMKNKKPFVYYSQFFDYMYFAHSHLDGFLYFEYVEKQKVLIESYYDGMRHQHRIQSSIGDEVYISEIDSYNKLESLYEKYNIEKQINDFIEKTKLKNNLNTFFELFHEYNTDLRISNMKTIKKYKRMYKLKNII